MRTKKLELCLLTNMFDNDGDYNMCNTDEIERQGDEDDE